ncbi:MAG TPA: dipicolinate synthase subunit DpsA [Clostridiales bacterium]|nr:dipicolinate synthase subunit DpsA [Clostridiales bacterium]
MRESVCVLGGDLRQVTVKKLLEEEGFKVFGIGISEEEFLLDDIKKAEILILPIPVSGDGITLNAPFSKSKINLSEITARIDKNCLVLGAKMPKDMENDLKSKQIAYIDYFEREELIIKNAIPTAEGVIEIALSEMPITLFESRVLVIGYGRVGKVIAEKFKALGSEVCVSARKCADFAWIKEKGMKAIHTESLENEVSKFDLVINTVPAKILDEKVLKNVRNDALILDVASKPGGVDFEVAKKLGKNVIWALSLPGKTAPITSGKIIKETIMNILSETEV